MNNREILGQGIISSYGDHGVPGPEPPQIISAPPPHKQNGQREKVILPCAPTKSKLPPPPPPPLIGTQGEKMAQTFS